MSGASPGPLRLRLFARGVVQGVGFRPHVYRVAVSGGLTGRVANTTAGVAIEVQGSADDARAFPARLRDLARPPIRIDELRVEEVAPVPGESRFIIEPSVRVPGAASLVPADLATCPDCVAETLQVPGRRLGYPFTNCTLCGPRFTIIREVPYDRPATTMAGFTLCPACRREYEDPLDRRYHAQPVACPVCGPHLRLRDTAGADLPAADPLRAAVEAILGGRTVALKGIGGFLLACDATREEPVRRLREHKRRGNKPFAIMVAGADAAHRACVIDADAEALLHSPAAPILLLRRRPDAAVADAVAPGQDHLGVMLPYSPLHHLLFARGAPELLVMTSGNRRDEPICTGEEAFANLAGIADLFVDHDRPIWNRCDDSVAFLHRGRLRLVRRARGYVPIPTALPFDAPPTLGIGGLYKGAICLAADRRAILSQHIGDTDAVPALEFLEEIRRNLSAWLNITPAAVGYDPHPGYAVSALARGLGLPTVPVQHHHAHVAATMVEAGVTGPLVGLALDGTGFGDDRTIWGGEILVADYGRFRRAGCLRPLPLPGGDAAIREPIRAALAFTAALDIEPPASVRALAAVEPQLAKAIRAAARLRRTLRTSSAGRLFDAVGVLLGGPPVATFEGEVAMGLEVLARHAATSDAVLDDAPHVPFAISRTSDGLLELDPELFLCNLAAELRSGPPSPDLGARLAFDFHLAVADGFARAAADVAQREGLREVALSGGVMQNRLLLELLHRRLERLALVVHIPSLVPANDGGLALGQAAVAAWRRRT